MAEAAAAKPPKKKIMSLLPWILAGAMGLGLAGFVAVYFLRAPKADAAHGAAPDAKKKEEAEHAAGKLESKSTVVLEPFLVNLADSETVRFVKASFHLGMESEKGGEEFSANKAEVAATRDAIISLLSSLTSEQILSQEGKAKLREEIKRRVNALSETKVADVYIVDFVVQL
jgi:flagellar protein FliL